MPDHSGAESGSRLWRVLLMLLALESGLFLILVPWSSIWEGNFFLGYISSLQEHLRSHYVRGAVTALGMVNIWVGFAEAWTLLRLAKRSKRADRS